MDIKTKYHYTYFLDPFVIDENKYEKFIYKILKDEKWKLRIFDKVKDMEVYTHFLEPAKRTLFPSFYWNDKYKEKISQYSLTKKAKELSEISCLEFVYDINDFNRIQGKVEQNNQIFFEITEIKLICFDTGACFLSFKTNIVDNEVSFRDLLNFNYKFKEVSSKYAKYRGKDNIYIQNNQFESLLHLSNFIDSITEGYVKLYNEDIYSDKMFVYSYACINESDWNNENGFEKIQDNFYKYTFQFSGDYDSDIELDKREYDESVYSKWKYSKYGFTKLGGVVFCSAVDHFNFTKLPVHYENVSFYIMLLAFYQRIALLMLDNQLKEGTNANRLSKTINELLINNRFTQISNSEHGMSLWKNWYKVFEIEELYNQVDRKYMRWQRVMYENKKEFVNYIIILLLILIYYILFNK